MYINYSCIDLKIKKRPNTILSINLSRVFNVPRLWFSLKFLNCDESVRVLNTCILYYIIICQNHGQCCVRLLAYIRHVVDYWWLSPNYEEVLLILEKKTRFLKCSITWFVICYSYVLLFKTKNTTLTEDKVRVQYPGSSCISWMTLKCYKCWINIFQYEYLQIIYFYNFAIPIRTIY